jgi:hypothetical protein
MGVMACKCKILRMLIKNTMLKWAGFQLKFYFCTVFVSTSIK